MFLEFYYFFTLSIIVLISLYVKFTLTDKNYLNELDEKIKELKKEEKSTIESQKEYITLLDNKNEHLSKNKLFSLILLIIAISNILFIKSGKTLYLFGFKIGFIITVLYLILFGIIISNLLERFIYEKPKHL